MGVVENSLAEEAIGRRRMGRIMAAGGRARGCRAWKLEGERLGRAASRVVVWGEENGGKSEKRDGVSLADSFLD